MVAVRLAALLFGTAAVALPLGGALADEVVVEGETLVFETKDGAEIFTTFKAVPKDASGGGLLSSQPAAPEGVEQDSRTFATPSLPKKPEKSEPAPEPEQPKDSKGPHMLDTNGNGKNDTEAYDTNGDGLFDVMRVDENEDGQIDYVLLDYNFNGTIDITVVFTTTDKGEAIAIWSIDANEDGKPEVYGVDVNGDGYIDYYAPV